MVAGKQRESAAPRSAGFGVALLILATAFWGSQFAVLKIILAHTSPVMVNVGRFAVAAAALIPFARSGRRLWARGAELGLWLGAGYSLQIVGLKYTTLNRSAFITSMTVIFVPLIGAMLGRPTRMLIWIAAIVGLLGCGLMSYDGSRPNQGDLWTLATAILFAIYIVRLETIAPQFPALALTEAQIVTVLAMSVLWLLPTIAHAGPIPWIALLYLGLLCTALTTGLQAISQKTVSASRAALIFTLEPVFAATVGYLVIHETLGVRGLTGAAMIVLAAMAAVGKKSPSTED